MRLETCTTSWPVSVNSAVRLILHSQAAPVVSPHAALEETKIVGGLTIDLINEGRLPKKRQSKRGRDAPGQNWKPRHCKCAKWCEKYAPGNEPQAVTCKGRAQERRCEHFAPGGVAK